MQLLPPHLFFLSSVVENSVEWGGERVPSTTYGGEPVSMSVKREPLDIVLLRARGTTTLDTVELRNFSVNYARSTHLEACTALASAVVTLFTTGS